MLTVRCHAKLPCKAARTFHAACMTWHAYACAYKLEAHAECLFALSDALSAHMTCYTSTYARRTTCSGRHGAGAMVARSMRHS